MKVPKRILPLVKEGIIDEVISRLMSGKEADVLYCSLRFGNSLRQSL